MLTAERCLLHVFQICLERSGHVQMGDLAVLYGKQLMAEAQRSGAASERHVADTLRQQTGQTALVDLGVGAHHLPSRLEPRACACPMI